VASETHCSAPLLKWPQKEYDMVYDNKFQEGRLNFGESLTETALHFDELGRLANHKWIDYNRQPQRDAVRSILCLCH